MFLERLRAIASRLEGASLVSLVAADGLPVETYGELKGLDLEELAVEMLTQARTIGENHSELDMGRVDQFSVTTDRYTALLGRLAAGYFLLMVLGERTSMGRARFELRRAPLAFEGDL